MEGGGFKLGGRAPFHVHELRPFIRNDEGAFKLPEVFRIDAEVRLERVLEFHALGYVNEGTAGKYRAVQGGEFVVSRGDDFAEPGAEDVFMVFQAFRGVDEDDALAAEFLLYVGVGGLGVILGFHARQELAFLFRDAQAFKGALYVFRHVVPASLGPFAVGKIVADLGEVYFFNVRGRPVGGHGLAFKDGKRIFAELAHPFRIVLDVADVVDGGLRQAVAGVEFMAFREGEVPLAPVEVKQVLFVPVL